MKEEGQHHFLLCRQRVGCVQTNQQEKPFIPLLEITSFYVGPFFMKKQVEF